MRPFISRSCSREDDRSTGSASLGVLFPARRRVLLSPLSCSREDDRLESKRLVRVLIAPEENVRAFSPSFSLGSYRSRGHPSQYAMPQPSAQSPATSSADLPAQRMRTQVPCRDAGTSATARTRNACVRSAAGRRLAARPNVVRTSASKPSMPRPRRSAGSEPKSAPKAIENPEVAPARGHAAGNFFPPPLCDRPGCYEPPVTSPRNPARYLLHRLPPGRSQRPGPGT